MAVREGRCPNCGSLIRVNREAAQSHCVFCWAPVDADEALKLAEDASNHHFPMETYSEPDFSQQEQVMKAYRVAGSQAGAKPRKTASAQPVKRKEQKKLTPAEQVAKLNAVVEPVETNRRVLVGALVAFVALFVVSAVVFIPLRNHHFEHRNQLLTTLEQKDLKLGEWGKDFDLQGLRNDHLNVVRSEPVTPEWAQSLYDHYQKAYQQVYAGSDASKLSVAVYADQMAYRVTSAGITELNSVESKQK